MKLTLTENQKNILKKFLLTEADDRVKKVEKIIEKAFEGILNLDGPVRGPEYYVNDREGNPNPNTTWRQYLMFNFRHTFGLMTNADAKYMPLIAKLAYSDEVKFDKTNENGNEITTLQKIVGLFKEDDALFQQVKSNPNITFNQLVEQLKDRLDAMDAADSEAANKVEVRNDYDIVDVPDFKTANYYGNYSCSSSKLCYTQGESTWNSYTQNGINRVYVCLKHGWKDIPEEAGEGNPYDDYGTSMIFVFIGPDGNIVYSNCRWNHRSKVNYNVDHAFTKTTLAETVGVRFDDVFKPHSDEELMAKGVIPFNKVQDLLDSGKEPKKIFSSIDRWSNGVCIVRLNGRYNMLKMQGYGTTPKLMLDDWYPDIIGDSVGAFYVYSELGITFVNEEGEFFAKKTNGETLWFEDVTTFINGLSRVKLSNRYNYINLEGKFLFDKWYDYLGYFGDNLTSVAARLGEKSNIINKNGEPLFDEWFDEITNQIDGVYGVKLNNKWNFVDENGRYASDKWISEFCDLRVDGKYENIIIVKGADKENVNDYFNFIRLSDFKLNSKDLWLTWYHKANDRFIDVASVQNGKTRYNFVDTVNGVLLFQNMWFDDTTSFCGGCAKVYLETVGWNVVNEEGEYVFKTWLDEMPRGLIHLKNGCYQITNRDNCINFINKNGELVSDVWFDYVTDFDNDPPCAVVTKDGKYNYLNANCELISKNLWFDRAYDFMDDGVAPVFINQKGYNYIDYYGNLISPNQWFDRISRFINGSAKVVINNTPHVIDINGNIVEGKNNKKSIIITESQEKMLKESILLNKIPEDIADAVYKNRTSIGNNPAIPNIFEVGYVEKLVEKRFKETIEELKKIGDINDVSDTKIEDVLNKLILKCQKLEEPNRTELEKIAANYLIDLFDIPDDSIQMELNLVDDVDLSSTSIKLDPSDGNEFIEYEDVIDAESIKDEVYKRRLIDAISMGAGMKISSNIKDYMKEIYEINPSLIDLYRKILALNDYLLFTKEDLGITDENKQQIGTVEVVIGQTDESPKILAQGVIFPILLSESVRGLMELFASHGLPQDFEKAQSVLSKADYLKAEPWDMRIGPALWEIITDSFDRQVETGLLPYLYKRITQLPVKKFNFFMKEVLAKTRKGKRMMAKLVQKAQYEKEYSGFEDKMSKFNTDKNVITDEYIHPDEL